MTSLRDLILASVDYTTEVEYQTALQDEVSMGMFIERLVRALDSEWFLRLHVVAMKATQRSGKRWCKVPKIRGIRTNFG